MIITYIFKSGRKLRLNSEYEYPKEFFYGYHSLIQKGLSVKIIEEEDLGINKKITFNKKLINFLTRFFGQFPLLHFLNLVKNKNVKLLNESQVIIATTYSIGMALGALKVVGILNKPVIFIVMGLIPLENNFWRKILCKYLLKDVDINCISIKEQTHLKNLLPQKIISYIPFGIDINFWKPNNALSKEKYNYVLAIGNDYARDWNTLINSWQPHFPDLKLVTNLPIKTIKQNIYIIKGSWGDEKSLKDSEIRELYLKSSFVIIPLKETIQPSGQSCCLQAMACGKPVIMTKIKGIWDNKLLKNKRNLLFVKPNSKEDLRNKIQILINQKDLHNELAINGRKLVEDHFNIELMAYYLEKRINNIFIN